MVHGAVLVFQVAALAAIAGWDTLHGFPLDDAWIHQVVARTFAQTGTLGYAPGHHGAGATSYLWAALLAVNYKVVHGSPGIYTFFLNALAYIGAGQCLAALILRAHPQAASERLWAGVTIAVAGTASLGGNFVWYAISGMEAPLVAFLPLCAIVLWTRPSRRSTIGAGICAAALALTRPEAALFAPLCLLWTRRLGKSRRDVLWFLAPWAAGLALYVGSNLIANGHLLPATLGGRRWLWLGEFGGAARWIDFFFSWCNRLQRFTLSTGIDIELVLVMTLAALGAWRMVRSKSAGLELLLAWTFAHVGIFLILMPTIGHGGRYQPLVPLLFLACATLGAITFTHDLLIWIFGKLDGRLGAVATVLAMSPLVAAGVMSLADWRDYEVAAVTHIRATEEALGPLVDALPADARVASYDIGAVGFFAKRPILDLGGLTDHQTATLLLQRRAWEVLRDWQASYVILPSWYRDDQPHPSSFGYRLALLDNPAIELEPVRELVTPMDQWLPSIVSTWNSSPRQVIYKIHYTGKPGPTLAERRAPAPAVSDPEDSLSWRSGAMLQRSLEVLAANDVKVAISLSRDKPAAKPRADDVWGVELGAWGLELSPPAKLAIPQAEARTLLAQAVQPFVENGDWGGAAVASTHGIARIVRRYVDARFLPFLPVLAPPGRSRPSGSSDGGGFPFEDFTAPILLLPTAALAWRARKRRGKLDLRLPTQAAAMFAIALALVSGCARDLAQAVDDGDIAVARMLDRGVDPNQAGALARAAEHGRSSALWLLLSRGAKPDVRDGQGRTPLHLATRRGELASIRALLQAGADPNAADSRGRTPLHVAVDEAAPEIVALLLGAGADPNRADAWGQTPLHRAAQIDWGRAARITQLLLDAHANPDARDARDYTPLHAAADLDEVPFVATWIAHGAALDAKNNAGETAADVALRARADRVAQLLIDAGATAAQPAPLAQAARTDDVRRALEALAVSPTPDTRRAALAIAEAQGSRHVAQLLSEPK